MSLEDKYIMLTCIQNCPDDWISKEILFNVLKWSYAKIDYTIDLLLQEKLVNSMTLNQVERYKVSYAGQEYIKNFPKNKSKDFFDKYTFNIILSIISFVLGILSSLLLK